MLTTIVEREQQSGTRRLSTGLTLCKEETHGELTLVDWSVNLTIEGRLFTFSPETEQEATLLYEDISKRLKVWSGILALAIEVE